MKSTFSKIALAVFSFGLFWSCKPELNPSVAVESVTLNKQVLELVVGQRDSLIATVLPENASDKSVVWASSADDIVTVTNGALNALTIGEATITVTTVEGKKTANCVVTVLSAPQPGSLDGVFSVSASAKVRFSKGNLRYSLTNSSWGFYPEQYTYGPAIYTEGHNTEISLFTWGYGDWSVTPDTKSHSTAYAEDGATLANSDDWGAVLAETGSWRTLTSAEWNYILVERDGAANKCKYGVTVCGNANCLVIAPDNFAGTIEASYTQETWAAAEQNDKLVCLPAAGLRNGDVTLSVGESGHYWTASSAGDNKALSIDTQSAPVKTAGDSKLAPRSDHRDLAQSHAVKSNNTLKVSGNVWLEPQSATVSNSKQQSVQRMQRVQKELVVKAPNEKKFQKAKNTNTKRSGANASGSRPAPKFASTPRMGESTNITIGTFSPATYPGEYYVTLTDANSSTQFFFDFDTSVNPFMLGKVYTLDDMIADYTAIGDKNDWYVWEPATAATYKETKDEKGLTHIVASMTTESGTYNLIYDQPEPQDINVTAVDWAYDEENFDVYVYSENTTYLFELKNTTDGLTYGTTFTYDDMVSAYTGTLYGPYMDIYATDATLTVTKDDAGLIHIAATMVLNGDKHIIAYDEKAFEPSGVQINVNGTNLNGQYLSTYGFYCYTAKWGDYTVQLPFNVTEEKTTYTNDDFNAKYGLIYSDDEDISLQKLASDITITETATIKTLTGSVYAKNGDEYILNLVYEKPAVEEITVLVEDATLTQKTLFFMVDGNDTESKYGITVKVNSKVLEGEFTIADCDTWNTGVTDLTAKKWFDTDSCHIKTQILGSNTLLMQGVLNTHNTSLGRNIKAQFALTARINADGELMDSYGGIVSPAKGDALTFFRSNNGTSFYKGASGLAMGAQSGKATMIAVNDSEYYWYNPISKFTTGYWIKGKKDDQANAIVFDKNQVINVYNGDLLGKMGWMKITSGGQISLDQNYSDVFAFDIQGEENDILTLRGSEPFDFTKDIHFPGVYVEGYGFQGYGDAGTILTTKRDTLKFNGKGVAISECVSSQTGVQTGWFYELADASTGYEFLLQSTVVAEKYGTFSYEDKTLGSNYYNVFDPKGGKQQFTEGSITVNVVGDELVLDGELIAEDGKVYVLHFTQPASVLTYDTDAPFDAAYAYNEMSASIENGVISIVAVNAEKQKISLELYADPASTTIPAGTYAISDTQEAGTALKSVGVDKDDMLAQCWAGTIDKDGYISDCWFLTEGNVVVSYDQYGKLHVEVDAKNSWGQTVTAEVSYEHVAVDPLLRENGYSVRLVSDLE